MTVTPTQNVTVQFMTLVFGLALLAAATILGYYGHISPTDTSVLISGLFAATGGLSLAVLASSTPNTSLVWHGVMTIAIVGAITALTLGNIWTSVQVLPFFGVMIGMGLAAGPAATGTPAGSDVTPVAPVPPAG